MSLDAGQNVDPETGFTADEKMVRAVNQLFRRLAAVYLAEWDRAMGQTPIDDVKAAWVHELAPFKQSLHRVAWALENLPERCPNPIVFKNLCRQAPGVDVPQLAAPAANPEIMKMVVQGIKSKPVDQAHGMKAPAYRLREREAQGYTLSRCQREYVQAALGMGA
jgi:hypothetical protein